MKFAAVVLLACVAVSSAAFTANLVQQTQPAMAKAMFNMRLAAGSNKGFTLPAEVTNAVNAIVAQVQASAAALLQNAQALLAHGQSLSTQLVQHLQNAAGALHGIGSDAAEALSQTIQNFIAQVQNTVSGNTKLSYAQAIAALQQQVQNAIAVAHQLIQNLDLPTLVQNAINAVLPPHYAQLVIAHMQLNNKGAIGDFFGNLFGGAIDAAQNAWNDFSNQVALIASAIAAAGSSAFSEVQAHASAFLGEVHNGVSTMTSSAAAHILTQIGQFQGALGGTYDQVVAALNEIVEEDNDNSQRRF